MQRIHSIAADQDVATGSAPKMVIAGIANQYIVERIPVSVSLPEPPFTSSANSNLKCNRGGPLSWVWRRPQRVSGMRGIADLLRASSEDFLDVMEVLFDRRMIRRTSSNPACLSVSLSN